MLAVNENVKQLVLIEWKLGEKWLINFLAQLEVDKRVLEINKDAFAIA